MTLRKNDMRTLEIFILALFLRLILVSLFGLGIAPDTFKFISLSESFDYSHSVVYPMVLGVLGPYGAVSLQIILDSLTAVLIASLSPAGGLLYAISLGPIVYSAFVLTDTLCTFFLATALWGALRGKSVTLLGGSLLCAIFTREISLLLSPLFLGLYFWQQRHGGTNRPARTVQKGT